MEAKMDDAVGFKQAYGVLQQHAETLRRQSEPNIDDLLRIVNESVAAYAICKSRIDAVEKALETTLASSGVAAGEPGGRDTRTPTDSHEPS
jgi:exodeoxyribonuclease VII small subunit